MQFNGVSDSFTFSQTHLKWKIIHKSIVNLIEDMCDIWKQIGVSITD
jgi:hypothetical protein